WLLQNTLAVDDSRNDHLVLLQSINDPLAIRKHFPNVLIIEFRDPAAGTWEAGEGLGLIDNAPDNNAGISGRIFGDVAWRWPRDPGKRVATRLFGEPFAEAGFHLFLRHRAIHTGVVQATPDLVEDVQVVLDVFHRAVVRELVEQLLDVLFRGAHRALHQE